MARYLRAATNAVTDGTGTSIAVDMDANLVDEEPVEPVSPGNFLLAQFRSRNAPVAPDGWTQLGETLDVDTPFLSHSVWYKTAGENEPSAYTFEQQLESPDGANGFMAVGVSVFADVDTSLLSVTSTADPDQPSDMTQIQAPAGGGGVWPSESLNVRLWAASRAASFGTAVPMKLVRSNNDANTGVRYSVIGEPGPGRQTLTMGMFPSLPNPIALSATAIDSSTGETMGDDPTTVETGRRNAFTVGLPSAPITPHNLHADPVSQSEIDTSWDDFQTGVNYRLRRDGVVIYDGPDTTFPDTGLDPSTTYGYDAQAYSDNMESAWTPVVSATTLSEEAPLPPSSPEAVAISTSEIDVSWDEEPDADGYRVQFGTEPFDAGAGQQVYDGTVPDFSHSGLQPSTIYYYRIQAYKGAVDGGWTALVQATTDDSKGNGDCGCPGDLPWPPDTSHFTPLPYVTTAQAERELDGEDS